MHALHFRRRWCSQCVYQVSHTWGNEVVITYTIRVRCVLRGPLYHMIIQPKGVRIKPTTLELENRSSSSWLCFANEDHVEGCPRFLQARSWLTRPMRDWQVRLQWQQVKVLSGFGIAAALFFLLCRFCSMAVLREDSKEEAATHSDKMYRK